MILHVAERLVLLELLPKEGDYAALKEFRKARELLSPSPEEQAVLEYRYDGNRATWDAEKDAAHPMDIPLSDWICTKVQELLISKNKDKKLVDREFTLYEKFVVNLSK